MALLAGYGFSITTVSLLLANCDVSNTLPSTVGSAMQSSSSSVVRNKCKQSKQQHHATSHQQVICVLQASLEPPGIPSGICAELNIAFSEDWKTLYCVCKTQHEHTAVRTQAFVSTGEAMPTGESLIELGTRSVLLCLAASAHQCLRHGKLAMACPQSRSPPPFPRLPVASWSFKHDLPCCQRSPCCEFLSQMRLIIFQHS